MLSEFCLSPPFALLALGRLHSLVCTLSSLGVFYCSWDD